jgi:hypothetical protein
MEIVRETANHFYDFGRKQQAIRNIQCTNSQVITPESYINEGQKKGIQIVLDNPQEYGLQKSAWSEEDEANLSEALSYIKDDVLKEFIKSLRPQKQWKPSDEQMKTLEESIMFLGTSCVSISQFALKSLYQDLKKLKGK